MLKGDEIIVLSFGVVVMMHLALGVVMIVPLAGVVVMAEYFVL